VFVYITCALPFKSCVMFTVIKIAVYLYHMNLVFTGILETISADVFVVTDANFTDKIRNFEVALVKFYVPW